ncbi:MAG: hypothetical protein ASARMPRED_003046 [Alectoria sarmentosa]|nr:MAG: hypothetical protein ASARMPRED_003046 [Alectoria sarmentosa]
MALSEPERGAFEGKFGLEQDQIDFGTHNHDCVDRLQNSHHLKDSSLKSSTSVNTSAHNKNAHITAHDFQPSITNCVDHAEIHLTDTQTSLEPSSSLPNSGETGDSLMSSSSQSAPDDVVDHSSIKLGATPVEISPALVQQPTSDIREETQPVSQEQTVQIKEQKEQQDLINDPELANGLVSEKPDPIPWTPELQPQTEFIAPQTSEQHPESVLAPSLDKDEASAPQPPKESASIPAADFSHHPPVPVPEGASTEAPIDPAPSPAPLAEISSPVMKIENQSTDQIMRDAPSPPAKVAREREDDGLEDGPAAKRSKTEQDALADFKVPERPAINTQVNGTHTEVPQISSPPMTQLQHKHCMRTIQNVKRIQSSTAFRQPVDYVAMNIPNYPNVIAKPMDLRTLEENLKENKYPTVDAFTADFNQIVQNCETFNGRESTFTKSAYDMKASFDKNMSKIPGPDVAEPSPADRKKKAIIPPAAKVAPPRRESRSSLPGPARSPISAGSPQTFALNPQGVPLIRRDSTFGDGRPKREIHPPAPRDLPYANQKPKKKKYQWELRFCEKVLTELSKAKYNHVSWPFMTAVDPVALNIPTYHSIIKKPMDFGSMKAKLDHGEYENAKEFEADARQVFQNCYRFNPQSDPINHTGHQFEAVFDSEWAKKRDWIEANTPGSGPQSAGSSEPEDSDEEDEEDDEEEEEQTQLSKLQQQIAAMSRQVELITQKKKSPPVSSKKATKGAKPVRKDTKKTAPPPKAEKKAASKPAKKEKTPYVTYEQKQDISNRINSLSESKMATALRIIRDNMPNLQGVQDDELELDIDELSDEVLHKLLVFVRKHAPHSDDASARPVPTTSSAAPTRKKNKPMSKTEQEARIAQVQNGLSAFQKGGSAPSYDDPVAGQESSGEDESSESEEE